MDISEITLQGLTRTLENATLLFEITTRCNLKCEHCFKNDFNKELTLTQIGAILEKVCAFGVIDLVLTGGEPFLREDIFEIVDIAEDCGIQEIAFTTNGTLLDNSKIIKQIKKRGDLIGPIMVSFNGVTAETHDFIRGKGEFDRLMGIIQKKQLRKLPLGLNITIGKWNFLEFNDFFELSKSFNGKNFNFLPFLPLGKGKFLKDQVLSPAQCLSMIKMAKSKQDEGYQVQFCFLPYANLYGELTSCCNLFTEFINITAQGHVVPCLYMHKYDCGSILEMDMDEIFSSQIIQTLSDPKKIREKIVGHCKACSEFNVCMGGCKLVTYALKGTIFESDPLCPITNKKTVSYY